MEKCRIEPSTPHTVTWLPWLVPCWTAHVHVLLIVFFLWVWIQFYARTHHRARLAPGLPVPASESAHFSPGRAGRALLPGCGVRGDPQLTPGPLPGQWYTSAIQSQSFNQVIHCWISRFDCFPFLTDLISCPWFFSSSFSLQKFHFLFFNGRRNTCMQNSSAFKDFLRFPKLASWLMPMLAWVSCSLLADFFSTWVDPWFLTEKFLLKILLIISKFSNKVFCFQSFLTLLRSVLTSWRDLLRAQQFSKTCATSPTGTGALFMTEAAVPSY